MADNYLITGYWGEPHVTAENDRGINAAIFGTGRYVLPVGEQFKAEYIGNNTIRLYDGKLIDNGAAAGIPVGEYVDLLISNAGQGMHRNDLIVFQYKKDASTLKESGTFIVVEGIAVSGTPTDPDLTQADILSGKATLDQMALWRVPVSGATIAAPVKLFNVKNVLTPENIKTATDLQTQLDGKAPYGLVALQHGAATDEDILADLDEVIAGMPDQTAKYIRMTGGPNTFLGGFVTLMKVFRASANFSTVKAYTYGNTAGGSIKEFNNSKYNGVWQEWTRNYNTGYKPKLTDLGLTATATELNYAGGVTAPIQGQLDGKANQVSLGRTRTDAVYTVFAKLAVAHNNQNDSATLLISDGGHGRKLGGAWLVQIGNYPEANMTVRELLPAGTNPPQFGCYTDGAYFCFGLYTGPYRLSPCVTVLNNINALVEGFGDSTIKPENWIDVATENGGSTSGDLTIEGLLTVQGIDTSAPISYKPSSGGLYPFLNTNNMLTYMKQKGYGRIATGAYAGNGADQVVACGFQPTMYILNCYDGQPSDGNYLAIFMPGSGLLLWNNEGEVVLGGVDTTGISLSDGVMNASGCAYTYIAFEGITYE